MKLKLIISALAAMLALSGCDHRPPPAPKTEVQKKISREAFSKAVMGKPENAIQDKFGKPYLVNDYAEQFGILWVYQNLTFDSATGRQDQFATVVFEHGVVARVVFK